MAFRGSGVKKAKKLRAYYMDGPLAVLHMYKMDFLKLKSTYHDLFQKEFPSHSNPFDSKCKDNPASKVETHRRRRLKKEADSTAELL